MTSKWWLRSRTIALNLAVALLAAAVDNLHLLGPLLSPRFFAVVAFALPLVNIALRIVTTQPISLKRPEEAP